MSSVRMRVAQSDWCASRSVVSVMRIRFVFSFVFMCGIIAKLRVLQNGEYDKIPRTGGIAIVWM